MKSFGEIVRAARKSRLMSLKQLADAAGTFKGYICGIEKGTLNPPSPTMIRRLSQALGLDYNELLASSAFEKLPKGLRFSTLKSILEQAIASGRQEARGGIKA